MICWPLFKRSFVSSLKLMIIFAAILLMYGGVIIYMYDPDLASILGEFQDLMPGVMQMMGMEGYASTLIGFVDTYLFGFIFTVVPMIYIILMGSRMVLKYVEGGSMALLLSSPYDRYKIIFTQAMVLVTSIIILDIFIYLMVWGTSEVFFPGELDMGIYTTMQIGCTFFHLMLGGITFLASSVFNDSKGYLAIGTGLPLIFMLINMLSNFSDDLSTLKYFTVFTMFDHVSLSQGDAMGIDCYMMLVVAVILFGIGIYVFKRKDLSL